MISHIDIAAAQKDYKPTDKLIKYINKKFGKLDRHMAKKNRSAARVEVKLQEQKEKSGSKLTCEAILHTPDYKLVGKESTSNMFASVDVVERKLRVQLDKYKDKHSIGSDRRKHQNIQSALRKFLSR